MVHGGGGEVKMSKKLSTWFMDDSLVKGSFIIHVVMDRGRSILNVTLIHRHSLFCKMAHKRGGSQICPKKNWTRVLWMSPNPISSQG